jgi:hypothetical protein
MVLAHKLAGSSLTTEEKEMLLEALAKMETKQSKQSKVKKNKIIS